MGPVTDTVKKMFQWPQWRRRITLGAICALVLVGLGEAIHNLRRFADYPSESDPKNTHYILWKSGLYPLDPEIAMGTMIGDPDRESVVIGKSKRQLEKTFGFITPIDQASIYIQNACRGLGIETANHNVFVLRKSIWIVVFSEERASDLILVKGS